MPYIVVHFKGSTNDAWGYPESITHEIPWYSSYTPATIIPTHTPARTGYTFSHWTNDDENDTYYPGETYYFGFNPQLEYTHWYLYARWTPNTYTVSFNLNGGTGTIKEQTKVYGTSLTLPTIKPTRTNYTFKGWGLSATSTTVSYTAGGIYSDNFDITLYAIWELDYLNPPTINNFKVYRSDSSGNSSDSGTYFKVSLDWSSYATISSILVEWAASSATTWSNAYIAASGTSGSASGVFGSGNVSVDRNYNVRVTVKDAKGSTMVTGRVGGKSYTVDFMPGGSGVAFGKYAEQADLFEVDWNARFNGKVTIQGEASIKKYDDLIVNLKNEIVSSILLQAYPVNSIYLSYSHINPADLFGGTWERLSPYYLYATGETGTIGETYWFYQETPDDASGGMVQGIKISAWRRTA